MVASGLVVGVAMLRAHPDVFGVLAAIGSLLSALAVACWPIAGRTAEEWLPTVVRWGADGVSGRRRVSSLPADGHCPGVDGWAPCAHGAHRGRPGRPALRAGSFAGLALLGVRSEAGAGSTVGVVRDVRTGAMTAVLALEGHSFALTGGDEKERRVSGWSGVRAALAREGTSVHRIQWVAVALPDDGRAVHAYMRERATLAPDSAPSHSYNRLLEEAGADTSHHGVLLAVQVRAQRSSRRSETTAAVLVRELSNLQRLLADADVACGGPLDVTALAARLRSITQDEPPTPSGEGLPARSCPPCLVGMPWPMATKAEWSRVRTDGIWHATYWIAEWPRVDIGPDFLAPLLLGPLRRAVSVVMEPVAPSRAVRAVEQARTADIADSELRRRGGFLATARRAREAELVVRRERELADGHGSYRFSGYVTVTASSASQLEEWCDATEHAAGQARLELRRLFGDQERALLCTLPLCRGLG